MILNNSPRLFLFLSSSKILSFSKRFYPGFPKLPKITTKPSNIYLQNLNKNYIYGWITLLYPLFIFFIPVNFYKKLLLFLIYHIIITLPTLTYLSKIYNWNFFSKTKEEKNFRHPYFLLTIAIGIIYPLFWGLFLTFSRYLRLGVTINIYYYLTMDPIYILIIFVLMPNLIILFFIHIAPLISLIRQQLWSYTELLFFSIHLIALQYYDYFRICELIHKSHFIIYDLFFQHPGIIYKCFNEKDKIPFFIKCTKLIQILYYKQYLLHILIISTILIEVIFFKGYLHYGIYTLFLYPVILSLFKLYHIMGSQDLILNMSLSDYLAINYTKPRYPINFWFYTKNPNLWFGFKHNLTENLQNVIDKTVNIEQINYTNITKFNTKLPYRIHGFKRNPEFMQSMPRVYGIQLWNKKAYNIRLAAFYKARYVTRWFHTTPILNNPKKTLLHPFTAKFIKDPFAILALLNKPEQNFSEIQQQTKSIKNWPKISELYNKTPNTFLTDPKHLIDILENNLVMRFKSLAEKNVLIGTYAIMKKKYGYINLETMQMRPDFISYWINNQEYLFKGYLGIDEKHKIGSVTNHGRNQVINSVTANEYQQLLNTFEDMLIKKNLMSNDKRAALDSLKEIVSEKNFDFDKLLDAWSKYLHFFPTNCRPPLMIEKTFDESHLTKEAIEKLRNGDLILQRISDRLYQLNVPTDKAEFKEKALDYYDDSFIKELHGSSEY